MYHLLILGTILFWAGHLTNFQMFVFWNIKKKKQNEVYLLRGSECHVIIHDINKNQVSC